jgi:hypothetical protein
LSGGGEADFHNGTYIANNRWQITQSNIALIADTGVVIDFKDSNPTNQNDSSAGILIKANNVSVQGFTIKNCDRSGLKVRDASNIRLLNNNIWNVWTGITFESVNDSLIDSNIVNLTQGDGIYLTGDYLTNGNSKNITVNNDDIYSVGNTGIDISNGNSNIAFQTIKLTSNDIKEFNNATTSPNAIGLGISIGSNVTDYLVAANTVDDMNFSLITNGKDGLISNNTLTDFRLGSGIWGTESNNVTASYNSIFSSRSSASNGIDTDKAWALTDNKITVKDLSGDSAIHAVNARKINNTNYVVTVKGNSMWNGTGEDWLLNNAAYYQTAWTNYLNGNFSHWNFNTVRMAFSTQYVGESQADLMNLTKMNNLLEILDNHGVKAILDCHGGVFNNNIWLTQWQKIVKMFENDTRILGYELINEPPTSNVTGNPVKVYNISSRTNVLSSLDALTRWIRGTDIIHYVIYPSGYIPKARAISNNMVVDFHFWDYSNQNTTQQLDSQISYRMSQLHAWDGYGYRYWLGEVGPHVSTVGGCQNVALEKYFVEQMVNNVTSIGFGFSVWLYSNNHWMTKSGVTYDDILSHCNRNRQTPPFSLADLVNIVQAYGSTPDSSNWNSAYDLNHDAIINISDLVLFASYYGR